MDTLIAPATPPGVSALALLRVSGPLCRKLAAEALALPHPIHRQASLKTYVDQAGHTLDELVATFWAGPDTYTGEDVLELSAHGNPLILQRLCEDLVARGCRMAEPGEFTRRALLHGKLSVAQAEALPELIEARSDYALRMAQRQLRGEVGDWVRGIEDGLIRLRAVVEAYIDFPEEDLPPEDASALERDLSQLTAQVRKMLNYSEQAAAVREGFRVVLAGPVNAGKSSLFNALLAHERALVSEVPHTTRDYLEAELRLGDLSIRLIDTAGLAEAAHILDERSMQRSRELIDSADLVLDVVDASVETPDGAMFHVEHRLRVFNKRDLLDGEVGSSSGRDVYVSATTGAGLESLKTAVTEALKDQLPPGDELLLLSQRQYHAMAEVMQALNEATALMESFQSDLLAAELIRAQEALAAVVGAPDDEALLDVLFSQFCIGK